jgi:hypothetical protein
MNGKLQVVKNPIFNRHGGKVTVVGAEHDVVFNQIGTAQFNKNCDAAQKAVETAGWAQVVKDLKMPNTCQPAERITPPGNRFGNV